MGRAPVITYKQVATVADGMKAAGSKPTSRSVRERLGNTGSMGTIHKHLQTWRAEHELPLAGPVELPASLQRAMVRFMEEELAKGQATHEAELAVQRQETADLAIENERLVGELEDQAKSVTSLQAERATLRGRLGQMETDLTAARKEAQRAREAAEAGRVEMAKVALRLEAMPGLEAELRAWRGEVKTERQGREKAERQAAVLTARLEAAIARVNKAEAEAAQAIKQAHSCGEVLAEETSKLMKAENNLAKLNGKLEAMEAQLQQPGRELGDARPGAKKAGAVGERGKRGRAK